MSGPTVCAECGAAVVIDDNLVALDTPPVEWDGGLAQWTLMHFGSRVIATAGDPSPEGLAHTLHEHQPEGSVMNA